MDIVSRNTHVDDGHDGHLVLRYKIRSLTPLYHLNWIHAFLLFT